MPADEDQRIEISLDQGLTTPYNYSFTSLTAAKSAKVWRLKQVTSGGLARSLLASRDIMQLNNIRDPQSGLTYYEGINRLVDFRYQNAETRPFRTFRSSTTSFRSCLNGGATLR